MAFLGKISASELPESTGSEFEPLPAGWYQACITGSDLTDTKSGSGQYIKVKYDILGPTHAGRLVWQNLNIRNQNPKAEEIGLRQLGEVLRALGLVEIEETDQLVGGNVEIKLAVKTDDYGTKNEVKSVRAIAQPEPAPAPAKPSGPAWARK